MNSCIYSRKIVEEDCLLQTNAETYFSTLETKKYNIICLQDVHINKQLEPFIKSEWGYDVFF